MRASRRSAPAFGGRSPLVRFLLLSVVCSALYVPCVRGDARDGVIYVVLPESTATGDAAAAPASGSGPGDASAVQARKVYSPATIAGQRCAVALARDVVADRVAAAAGGEPLPFALSVVTLDSAELGPALLTIAGTNASATAVGRAAAVVGARDLLSTFALRSFVRQFDLVQLAPVDSHAMVTAPLVAGEAAEGLRIFQVAQDDTEAAVAAVTLLAELQVTTHALFMYAHGEVGAAEAVLAADTFTAAQLKATQGASAEEVLGTFTLAVDPIAMEFAAPGEPLARSLTAAKELRVANNSHAFILNMSPRDALGLMIAINEGAIAEPGDPGDDYVFVLTGSAAPLAAAIVNIDSTAQFNGYLEGWGYDMSSSDDRERIRDALNGALVVFPDNGYGTSAFAELKARWAAWGGDDCPRGDSSHTDWPEAPTAWTNIHDAIVVAADAVLAQLTRLESEESVDGSLSYFAFGEAVRRWLVEEGAVANDTSTPVSFESDGTRSERSFVVYNLHSAHIGDPHKNFAVVGRVRGAAGADGVACSTSEAGVRSCTLPLGAADLGGAFGSIIWRDGSETLPNWVPRSTAIVVTDEELLGAIVLAALLVIAAVCVASVVVRNRNTVHIAAAHWRLMVCTTMGVVVGCVFIILLLLPASEMLCVWQKTSFIAAVVLIFVPMVLKVFRYWRMAKSDADISERMLLSALVAVMVVQGLLVMVWMSAGSGGHVVPSDAVWNFPERGISNARYLNCATDVSEAAPMMLALVNLMLFLVASLLCCFTRNVSDKYVDAKDIKRAFSACLLLAVLAGVVLGNLPNDPLNISRVGFPSMYLALVCLLVLPSYPHLKMLRAGGGLCGGRRGKVGKLARRRTGTSSTSAFSSQMWWFLVLLIFIPTFVEFDPIITAGALVGSAVLTLLIVGAGTWLWAYATDDSSKVVPYDLGSNDLGDHEDGDIGAAMEQRMRQIGGSGDTKAHVAKARSKLQHSVGMFNTISHLSPQSHGRVTASVIKLEGVPLELLGGARVGRSTRASWRDLIETFMNTQSGRVYQTYLAFMSIIWICSFIAATYAMVNFVPEIPPVTEHMSPEDVAVRENYKAWFGCEPSEDGGGEDLDSCVDGDWAMGAFSWSYPDMPLAHMWLEMLLYWTIGLDYFVKILASKNKMEHIMSITGIGDLLSLTMWMAVRFFDGGVPNFVKLDRGEEVPFGAANARPWFVAAIPSRHEAAGAGEQDARVALFVALLCTGFVRCLRLKALVPAWLAVTQRVEGGSRVQIFELVAILLSTILFIAGFIWVAESPQQGDVWEWHDFLYFAVVTMSTVGYGDTSITTSSSRFVMLVVIMYVIIVVPDQASRITSLVGTSRKIMRLPSAADEHVVVVVGALGRDRTQSMLDEFFHKDRGHTNIKMVLLSPLPADDPHLKSLLQSQHLNGRVSYLQGSPLKRADVHHSCADRADAVFFVSTDPRDDETVVAHSMVYRSLLKPRSHVYLQLRGSVAPEMHSMLRNSGVSFVTGIEDMRGALLAKTLVCPGFSAFVSNLMLSASGTSRRAKAEWQRNYTYGRGMESYSVAVPEPFHNVPFAVVALMLYSHFNVTVYGVEIQIRVTADIESGLPAGLAAARTESVDGHRGFLVLNPPATFPLLDGDQLLAFAPDKSSLDTAVETLDSILSLTADEVEELARVTHGIDEADLTKFVADVGKLRVPDATSTQVRAAYVNGILSRGRLVVQARRKRGKLVDFVRGGGARGGGGGAAPAPAEDDPAAILRAFAEDSKKSSESRGAARSDGAAAAAAAGGDGGVDGAAVEPAPAPTAAPHADGAAELPPGIKLPHTMFRVVAPRPLEECIVDDVAAIPASGEWKSHVIVTGDSVSVFPLIKYLRLRSEATFYAVVWLTDKPLTKEQWLPISQFPWVYVLLGVAARPEDMERAGVAEAARILLLADSSTELEVQEATDARNALTMVSLPASVRPRLMIEYSNKEGFFLGDGPKVDHFSLSPMFASGQAWAAPCTVYEALVNAFWSPQTMRFVEALLFGADTGTWNDTVPRLELVNLPPDFAKKFGAKSATPIDDALTGGAGGAGGTGLTGSASFVVPSGGRFRLKCGQLFQALVTHHGALPLGLYRFDKDAGHQSWYVYTNPPAETYVRRTDKVFVLQFASAHDGSAQRHGAVLSARPNELATTALRQASRDE